MMLRAAMRCPVLTYGMPLPGLPENVLGQEVNSAMSLRRCYAEPGTDKVSGATGCIHQGDGWYSPPPYHPTRFPVLTQTMLHLSCTHVAPAVASYAMSGTYVGKPQCAMSGPYVAATVASYAISGPMPFPVLTEAMLLPGSGGGGAKGPTNAARRRPVDANSSLGPTARQPVERVRTKWDSEKLNPNLKRRKRGVGPVPVGGVSHFSECGGWLAALQVVLRCAATSGVPTHWQWPGPGSVAALPLAVKGSRGHGDTDKFSGKVIVRYWLGLPQATRVGIPSCKLIQVRTIRKL
eukprot:784437-Rhodomonas_salina.2